MQILSVNIGTEQPIANGKKTGTSGIFKLPTSQPVAVGRLGLVHDAIIDTDNHGGYDQAVYLYGTADYDWWAAELGTPLHPGLFGENLTITGLSSAEHAIGDRFTIGDLLLEVTAPRIPCATLNARMSDNQFVKRFRAAERPGLYCRVLIPATIQVGMSVGFQPAIGHAIPIREAFQFFFARERHDKPTIRRFLAAPIDQRARAELDAEYAALLAAETQI